MGIEKRKTKHTHSLNSSSTQPAIPLRSSRLLSPLPVKRVHFVQKPLTLTLPLSPDHDLLSLSISKDGHRRSNRRSKGERVRTHVQVKSEEVMPKVRRRSPRSSLILSSHNTTSAWLCLCVCARDFLFSHSASPSLPLIRSLSSLNRTLSV